MAADKNITSLPFSPAAMLPLSTSRRGSIASLSSRAAMGHDSVSQALDDIHASASRSTSLTAFHEFAPPPPAQPSGDDKSSTGALGSFYHRFKSSVSGPRSRPGSAASSRPPSVRPHAPSPPASRPTSKRSNYPVARGSGELTQKSVDAAFASSQPGPPTVINTSLDAPDENTSTPAVTGISSRSSSQQASHALNGIPAIQRPEVESPVQSSNVEPALNPALQPRKEGIVLPSVRSHRPSGSSLLSPHTTSSRTRDPLMPADAAKSKSLPFASVTNLNVPASILHDVSETQTEADVASTHSLLPSPGLTRASSKSGQPDSANTVPNTVMNELRRKVLSRDFWMKDENAKVCFSCGDAFTTFRRKHHCRTCGQIYDAKCTVLISGTMFDQPGRLRICRICENIIMGDQSSEELSEGEDQFSASQPKSIRFSNLPWGSDDERQQTNDPSDSHYGHQRNPYDLRRRTTGATAQDVPAQTLTRPSSSRSLKSISSRPRSSSHKLRRSRHQHIRSLGTTTEDNAPFQKPSVHTRAGEKSLPAFHTDAIVDPDLAPYMSDEASSDEEMQSMGSVLHGDLGDFGQVPQLSGSLRKSRTRPMSSRSQLDIGAYDNDDVSSIISSRNGPKRKRITRTQSVGSINTRPGASHRLIRSENLFADPHSITSYSLDGPEHGRFVGLPAESLPTPLGPQESVDMGSSSPPKAELDNASMRHVKQLLKQLLDDGEVENGKQWKKLLVSILLRCAEEVDPSIQRGDDIDIRQYVKLKKAPGRDPTDSFYISGVVFSKNVALKGMPRSVLNARILLLSFPIVYARHKNHFMSLDPVIAQESEYLRNLVRRIVALRPSVVLVQRQVAGLALDFLKDAGIAVVCNMKESVLQAVARCTQTQVITSVDKLTMDPSKLGFCEKFEFRTLVFNDIRKTFAFVSGCAKDLGCTIVLRGSQTEELRKIKRITEFMAYVVYNLKLETSLIRDQFMTMSDASADDSGVITMGQLQFHLSNSMARTQDSHIGRDSSIANRHGDDSLEYDQLVSGLKSRILSISPAVRLAPPFLLLKAQEQERQMRAMKDNLDKAENMQPEDLSAEKEVHFELLQPEMIFSVTESTSALLKDSLKSIRRAEYERSANHFAALKRRWESYISGALDPFSPLSHQQIVVLYSIVSTPSGDACEGPDLIGINFYQEHDTEGDLEPDVPLGEYIERICDQADTPCTSAHCNQLMLNHHRTYVHGEGQVTVHIQEHPSKLRGLENTILMWTVCRECNQETPVIPMSRNSWKYSFAKYMERAVWSRTLRPRTGLCSHDVQRHHTRYFGFNKLAVSIQYDPIRILEVMVPRNAITWNVQKDVQIKNLVYSRIETRIKRFLASVLDRINSINLKSIDPDLIKDCRREVERLRQRVSDDEDYVLQKLREKYSQSQYFEIIPMNRALRAMQERVSAWGGLFADFERKYLPSERDIRKLAAQRLKDVYLEHEHLHGSENDTLTDADEKRAASEIDTRESSGDPLSHDAFARPINPSEPSSHLHIVQSLDLAVEDMPPTHSPYSPRSSRRETSQPPAHVSAVPSSVSPSKQQTASPRSVSSRRSPVATSHHRSTSRHNAAQRSNGSSQEMTATSPPLLRSHTQPPPRLHTDEHGNRVDPTNPRPLVTKAANPSMIPVAARMSTPIKAERGPDKSELKNAGLSKLSSTPTSHRHKGVQSMIPRSIVTKSINSRVSALARQFEQMSREFEREKAKERKQRLARIRQTQVYSVGSYQPVVEVYRDAHEAVQEQEPALSVSRAASQEYEAADKQSEHIDHEDVRSVEEMPPEGTDVTLGGSSLDQSQENMRSEESTMVASYPPSDVEHALSDAERAIDDDVEDIAIEKAKAKSEKHLDQVDLPKHDKNSILKILSSFWSERSASGWTELEYPLHPTDHIFSDSDVIPREDEPSSIIAFSLSSDYYRSQLQAFRDRVKADPSVLVNPPSGETEIEQTLLGRTATHVSYTFLGGAARMRCKVFFAESFDAIQQKCGVSDRIVESLSRCFKFDSKGGKTKSIFLKTLDERFVLKSLSQVETDAFLRFAPDYFDYMSKCLFHNLPSALAKMLGFYEVTIKNPETGVDFSCFLQLMENVFYEGPSNQTFDLKGSMRNRRVKSTGNKDEVLLDENLLDYISSAPIYIRNHANSQLASSISNDTLFCSKQNVMDYSLIVGLYDDRQELMVGIIDYIRTYTWDKKLESWIKDRGKNKPTVRSPKDYRNRFRASISRYFPLAPSCWQIFGIQRTEQPPLAWWESLGHRNDLHEDGLVDMDGAESDEFDGT